jgi:hypothetical protein
MPAMVARFAAPEKPRGLVGLGYHSVHIWAMVLGAGSKGGGNPMRYDPGDHIHTLLIAVSVFLLCLLFA